jgi:translation initiation factor eIF-2B subunit beta
VLLVPDAAVYALMPRVSKLVLAPHCVLPNGALLAPAGSALLASAARAHHTPVIALAGLHRISPDWALVAAGSQTATEGDPALVLPREHSKLSEEADVVSATWDCVETCDGLITNVGEHAPSFVPRLIKENYYVEP